MNDPIPVNRDVLRWARETMGLAPEAVAAKLGRKSVTADTVLAWEAGNGAPTYSQMETLAHEVYKRPLAVFFFPTVPVEETLETDFRTLPDTVVADLPPTLVRLYRRAKLFQVYLEELYEGAKPVERSLLDRLPPRNGAEFASITAAIRGVLRVSIEEQMKWRSAETAFKRWREVLETSGIFVFKDAFRNNDYSGFCLYSDNYPIIFVNNSMPDSRQVFTLFHELGHLLYRSGGIDFRSRQATLSFRGYYLDVEVSCNRFANEFLVPPKVLDALSLEVSEARFEALAEFFSVSREVILRNYLDRGLVDADYYEQVAAQWAEQTVMKREGKPGGNYYYSARTYLGEKYIDLVYSKFYQNKITSGDVAEYLNVKAKNLLAFERLVLEGGNR